MPLVNTGPTTEMDKVVLKHLKSLEFGWMGIYVATDTLQGLTLPTCDTIHIACRETVLEPERFSDLVETVMEILPTSNVTMEIQCPMVLSVSGGRWTLSVEEDGHWNPTADGFRRLLVHSLPPIARSAVSAFNLTGPSWTVRNIILPILDEACPNLAELRMTLSASWDFELDSLCGPQDRGWLLSNLQTFHVDAPSLGANQLAAAVEVARARRNKPGVMPLTTFKATLRRFEGLRGSGKGIFEEMEELYEIIDCDPQLLRGHAPDADVVFSKARGEHR